MALRQSVAVSGINERVKAYHPPMEAPYSCVTRGAWLCSVRLFYPCLNGPLGLQTIVSSPTSFLLSPACSLTFLFKRFPLIDKTSECSIYIAPLPLSPATKLHAFKMCKTWCVHCPEIDRCRIAIHLSIPMHRFIDAPIHRTDSNASFITDASGLNRCIGTELMNRFKIITDYYRCIGKNYQCIGNLAMHRI